jgi:succinyl-CoA synthetase beta subunit
MRKAFIGPARLRRGPQEGPGRIVMNLMEYRAKELFREFGIPTPEGYVAETPDAVQKVDRPVVVKAQVLTGGRGKAGGIQFAATTDEARAKARQVLGMSIKGHPVRRVLVEPRLDIAHELYVGFVIDRSVRAVRLLASSRGGMDIESVPKSDLFSEPVDIDRGVIDEQLDRMLAKLALPAAAGAQVRDMTLRLWRLFTAKDATMVEINPLAVTRDGRVVAADAKLTVDDDALFRHPEMGKPEGELTALEAKAKEKGIAFVQLDGNISVIANGAGLTMATLDAITAEGGRGNVFLDLGGGDDLERMKSALRLSKETKPKVVLLNIFGGITKCDTVAMAVRDVFVGEGIDVPVVARIRGRNEELARTILKDAGLIPAKSLQEAARLTVELSKGGA